MDCLFWWEEKTWRLRMEKDVARLLVDEYLNCHPTGHKNLWSPWQKAAGNKRQLPHLSWVCLAKKVFQRSDVLRSSKRSIETDGRWSVSACKRNSQKGAPGVWRCRGNGDQSFRWRADGKNVYLLPACRKYGRIWGICGLCPWYPPDTAAEPDTVFVEWFAKAEKGSAFLKRAKMVYSGIPCHISELRRYVMDRKLPDWLKEQGGRKTDRMAEIAGLWSKKNFRTSCL